MKQILIIIFVITGLFLGVSLFFSFVLNVSSSFKLGPSNQAEIIGESTRKTELERKKFMEDYEFKMEQYKRTQNLYPKH